MTPNQFAAALGQVESSNRSNPPLGDGGRARGRYQMHPDWFDEWRVKLNLPAILNETWDAWDTRIVQGYFNVRIGQGLTPAQTAVSYHLGHICRETDADWDQDYADDFNDAAKQP